MSTTKANLFKVKNNSINTTIRKDKHHHKAKSKSKGKKEPFQPYEPRFEPYPSPSPKGAGKSLLNDDINSFWKYSPRNPFVSQKLDRKNNVTVSTTSTISKQKILQSSATGNMSSLLSRRESENTAAVNEARREIEKIKTELETLINANIKTQSFYTESMNLIQPEIESLLNTAEDVCNNLTEQNELNEPAPIPAPAPTPAPTIRVNPPKPVIKTTSLLPSPNRKNPTTPTTVPCIPEDAPIQPQTSLASSTRQKWRTYDADKTREFIKKQKQRRKEKLLEEEQNKQQKENARKNKLEELKKKTLELVAKNLKKSSSKSAKSPSDLSNASKSTNAQIDKTNKLLQSRRCRARSFDNVNRDKESDYNKRSRSVSKEITSKLSEKPPQQLLPQQQLLQPKIPEKQSLIGTKSQVSLQSNSQKSLTTPKINLAITTITNKNKKDEALIIDTKENIKIESPKENIIISEIHHTKPNLETHNSEKHNSEKHNSEIHNSEQEIDAAKELSEIKQKLETSITQIKDKNEFPIWLQPPSSVPYPYNFISAVRKKLEYVTRKQPPTNTNNNNTNNNKLDEINKLNVSIQCSIDKKILDVNSVNIPKLESPKNTNRTYESHKCRRQLYTPEKIKSNEIEINIKSGKSESDDSDTTKNIPELPHEEIQPTTKENKKNITFDKSNTSFKNITFERNIPPKLNMGDIKLPEPVKYAGLIPPDDKIDTSKISRRKSRSKYPEDIDSILSHYSKIKSEHNSYSDDFNSVSSKPEKSESITEYKQIPSLTKSKSISEHLQPIYSNSSSKENIFESEDKSRKHSRANSILSENRTIPSASTITSVSTETNRTMKDVPSLSSQQIKTDSSAIQSNNQTIDSNSSLISLKEKSEENLKKLKKPEVFLKRRVDEIENNPNHVHLKLQAEVHLLNSFNNSLKQIVAVEKSIFDVPSTSNTNFNPINAKRGCDFTPPETPKTSHVAVTNGRPQNGAQKTASDYEDSICSQDLVAMSNICDRSSISTTIASNSIISRREDTFVDVKSHHPYVAISLDMVDQLIKDEDVRLEHLKAVLKLRDQALFDRIKGELALLEIRKRQLREHGLTNDITAIKKKQRGLIIKLQQERHEMHRLKTAHKQAAKARKTALHEQKSIIKKQLSSTDQIPKKLRRLSQLERPSLGPVKVYRVDSKTEVSETTLSRKSHGACSDDTNSSVLTQISEKISVEKSEIYYSDSLTAAAAAATISVVAEPKQQPSLQSEKLKRSLLMKEAEIDKRRKEIEDLIKWQKRLKQKEAEVVELERKAVKSLQQSDDDNAKRVRVFSGAHLNKVWKGIIAQPDKNFDEQKKYQMSKRSLDKFYQNARKMFREVSDEEKREQKTTESSYSSEFEQTTTSSRLINNHIISVPEPQDEEDAISSIHTSIKEFEKSSEDISSIQEDEDNNKSVSLSETQSVKTEVNTLIHNQNNHSNSKSEFIDSLQSVTPPKSSKSLELIIASNSIVSESLKTDSLDQQNSIKISSEISENSTTEDISSSVKPEILDSLDSEVKSITEVSEISKAEILDTSEPPVEENIISIEETEKTDPQIVENIISSEISSVKPDSEVVENIISERSLIETTDKSEPQIIENIVSEISKLDSEITKTNKSSIEEAEITSKEATEKSDSQIAKNIVSDISKVDLESSEPENIISEISPIEKSEPQVVENIVSEISKVDLEVSESENIISEKSLIEETEKSELQIIDNIVSETSKIDSEILESRNISEKDSIEEHEKSDPQIVSDKTEIPEKSEHEIQDSLNSSIKSEINEIEQSPEKSEPTSSENIESANSSAKSEIEESAKSEPKDLENIPESDKSIESEVQEDSNKVESWEPQIISETKSDSSENQIKSEQNIQTDPATTTTTPRSEIQYETDFDKISESESNVSLKETNVDSSVNEEEDSENIESPEKTSESNTVKVSPKEAEREKSDSEYPEDEEEDLNESKKGVSHIDVRKRVSEILADANANGPRGDKSPRVQDLYTTTYDIAGSSESTPESGSPTNEFNNKEDKTSSSFPPPETPYVNEAEELLRKQLEIEQEIKRLERQQQNIPYLFMREIPNKPPPPYKPPDFPLTPVIASIIPSKPEQTNKIISDATSILYSAYSTGNLANTAATDTKDDQQRFMFDLCKEIALDACTPTIETRQPSWKTEKNKFHNLFGKQRPITKQTLNTILSKKVLQLLNFEPVTRNDSLIIRWSRKKRDHVDEILVSETQAEETEWTNFDSDEEVIKENLTQNILDMLIVDAATDFNSILLTQKKKLFKWVDC